MQSDKLIFLTLQLCPACSTIDLAKLTKNKHNSSKHTFYRPKRTSNFLAVTILPPAI